MISVIIEATKVEDTVLDPKDVSRKLQMMLYGIRRELSLRSMM